MFPAYTSDNSLKPSENNKNEWLSNTSYNKPQTKINNDQQESKLSIQIKYELEEKQKNKKHKKKSKKKKKKQRKLSSSSSSSNLDINETLLDKDYIDFFAKFSNEEIKKAIFLEDIPGLTYRNAFKIDKKGDRNNLCFDTLHYKLQANYKIPFERNYYENKRSSLIDNLKNKSKKLSRTQLRKLIIKDLKQKRYFININKIQSETDIQFKYNVSQKINTTLSDKMWLYLQMKKNLDLNYENKIDKTAEYMKYLNENKTDIKKWLEFINYQSIMNLNNEIPNKIVNYERKKAIFEKAIKENPTSFRLRIELIKLKADSIEFNESIEKIEDEFFALLFTETSISFQIISKMKQLNQLKILTNLFEIWFELIKFLNKNNSSSLSFNKIKLMYIKFFQYFLNSTNPIILKNMKTELFLNNILNGIENYCSFLSKAGYYEKGIAIYQSLIDLNFTISSPNHKNLDFNNRKNLFELYAEIGLPKVNTII